MESNIPMANRMTINRPCWVYRSTVAMKFCTHRVDGVFEAGDDCISRWNWVRQSQKPSPNRRSGTVIKSPS